jgi:hypothetical protein
MHSGRLNSSKICAGTGVASTRQMPAAPRDEARIARLNAAMLAKI